MVRTLLLRNVVNYGGDEKLTDRLLLHGGKTYFIWAVRSIINTNGVYESIHTLSTVLDVPVHTLSYAYFSSAYRPKFELRSLPEYEYVMNTLNAIHESDELWLSMSSYCWNNLKRLCIEELVSRDEIVKSIASKLNVSLSLVYVVRRNYLKRELKEKAKNDT